MRKNWKNILLSVLAEFNQSVYILGINGIAYLDVCACACLYICIIMECYTVPLSFTNMLLLEMKNCVRVSFSIQPKWTLDSMPWDGVRSEQQKKKLFQKENIGKFIYDPVTTTSNKQIFMEMACRY